MKDERARAEVGVGKCRFETLEDAVAWFITDLADLSRQLAQGTASSKCAQPPTTAVVPAEGVQRPAAAAAPGNQHGEVTMNIAATSCTSRDQPPQ